ncbi:hypothetical protein ISCGN_027435 [Ixodes scapularis]
MAQSVHVEFVLCVLFVVDVGGIGNEPDLYYQLFKTCNGSEIESPGPRYKFNINFAEDGEIPVELRAPFYDDACVPPGIPGAGALGVVQYEAFQIYFLGSEGYYLRIDIGPYGHYAVFLADIKGTIYKNDLMLSYASNMDRYRGDWTATIRFPAEYLPRSVSSLNAYARHGRGASRQVLVLNPPMEPTCDIERQVGPDFESFEPFDILRIDPAFDQKARSEVWKRAFEDYYWSNSEVQRPSSILMSCVYLSALSRYW